MELAWNRGIERLRHDLIQWYAYHTSRRVSPATDYLQKLEDMFTRFFPGAHFVGIEPREVLAIGDFESYFLIQRNERVYDIAEMSSGEQAIFPLLYEFARHSIARSIVLIDELELHLHPPLQQMLLSALRTIGPDCQFIVTTHSPYLEEATPDELEIRLPGGRKFGVAGPRRNGELAGPRQTANSLNALSDRLRAPFTYDFLRQDGAGSW